MFAFDVRFFLLLAVLQLATGYECGRAKGEKTLVDGGSGSNDSLTPRIIGGEQSTISAWPWQVIILWAPEYNTTRRKFCGGTLISPNFVLTAAHCAVNQTKELSTVHLGSVSSVNFQNPVGISEIIIHPFYAEGDHLANDIAILKLKKTVKYTNTIQPICLNSGSSADPNILYASGFGRYIIGNSDKISSNRSASLQHVKLPLIPLEVCRQKWSSIRENQICAGAHRRGIYRVTIKNGLIVQGDSGGPLQAQDTDGRWFQLGITSFSGNGEKNAKYAIEQDLYPGETSIILTCLGGYTRVSSFCGYIFMKTDGEARCQNATFSIMTTTKPLTTIQTTTPGPSTFDHDPNSLTTIQTTTPDPSAASVNGLLLAFIVVILWGCN